MTEVVHQAFPTRVTPLRKAVEDSDCERDRDGLISDAEVEKARSQLATQQYLEEVDAAHLTEPNGDKPKSLAAVREEARQFMVKSMQAGAQVEIAEYEVDDEL